MGALRIIAINQLKCELSLRNNVSPIVFIAYLISTCTGNYMQTYTLKYEVILLCNRCLLVVRHMKYHYILINLIRNFVLHSKADFQTH